MHSGDNETYRIELNDNTPEPLAIFSIIHRAPRSLWPSYQSLTEHPRAFGHLFSHIQSTPEPSTLYLVIRVPPKVTDPSAIEHFRVFILVPHHPQGTLEPLESLTFFLKNQSFQYSQFHHTQNTSEPLITYFLATYRTFQSL